MKLDVIAIATQKNKDTGKKFQEQKKKIVSKVEIIASVVQFLGSE